MTDDFEGTSPPAPSARARRDDTRMHTVEMAALPGVELEDAALTADPARPPLTRWQIAALVALGGGIGSLLRWTLTLIGPTTATPTLVEIPWATLTANLLGCIGLGALTGVLESRPARRRWIQPLVGPGMMGGFTTMSTLVLDGSAMMGAGFPYQAGVYALLTLGLCVTGAVLGVIVGHWIGRRRTVAETHRDRAHPDPTVDTDHDGTLLAPEEVER